MSTTLWRNARLATLAGTEPWGWVERGALLIEGRRSRWVGDDSALPTGLQPDREHRSRRRAGRRPGWSTATRTWSTAASARASSSCDCKAPATRRSHAPAAASARRWRPRAPPATSNCSPRPANGALTLMAEGVTTLEIKSGYGLSAEHEARCLRIARRLGRELPLTVRTTCLSAHMRCRRSSTAAPTTTSTAVCAWLPALHAEGLVDAVDAFCETHRLHARRRRGACSRPRERLGLPVKLHAEQLSDCGGAALAASLRRAVLRPPGVPDRTTACAPWPHAGTVAVLLPGAFYFLRETKLPPVQALRDAGVPIAHRQRPQSRARRRGCRCC